MISTRGTGVVFDSSYVVCPPWGYDRLLKIFLCRGFPREITTCCRVQRRYLSRLPTANTSLQTNQHCFPCAEREEKRETFLPRSVIIIHMQAIGTLEHSSRGSFNGRFPRKILQQNSPQEAIMSTLRLVQHPLPENPGLRNVNGPLMAVVEGFV